MKGRYTVAYLLSCFNNWVKSRNTEKSNGRNSLILDFSKASLTVAGPHRRLLLKLERYGVDGSLLKWFQSFLIGRSQRDCFARQLFVMDSRKIRRTPRNNFSRDPSCS